MTAIYKRELKEYFFTKTGYIFLLLFSFIMSVHFSLFNIISANTDYPLAVSNAIFMLMIIIPIITMKLFCAERENKTDRLIFTAPVRISAIVLGKFFAAFTLFAVALAITVIFPIILSFFGKLPISRIIGSYLGLIFMGACFISVGMLISSVSENQYAAALGTVASLFVLLTADSLAAMLQRLSGLDAVFCIICSVAAALLYYTISGSLKLSISIAAVFICAVAIGYIYKPNALEGLAYNIASLFSAASGYAVLSLGVFDISAVIYYLSVTSIFLFLTSASIEKRC